MKKISLISFTVLIGLIFFVGSVPAAIYNGHDYQVVYGDWFQSENSAIALGGHLVTINDQAEQDWLASYFGSGLRWIGFTDNQSEGDWIWVSGESSTYTNWADQEPNNMWDGGEDYAVINWRTGGKWNDLGPNSPEWGGVTMGIAEIPNVPTSDDEIIGTWDSGIWYFYPPYWSSGQTRMYADTPDGASPSGDIEAGDTNGDGVADVASCWASGLYLQNGSTRTWEYVYSIAPYKVTMANVYGDARKEIIGTWVNGVFYFYRTSSGWAYRQITNYPPAGDMSAGDITGDGWDEVVSGYSTGTWIWNPITGGWAQLTSATYIPYNLACGDGNGDGRAEVVGGFHTGVWSWDRGRWSRLTSSGYATTGDMEMGDFNNNGRDDLVSNWPDGMWIRYDNGSWYKAYNIAPYRVTTGNIVDN